MGNENNSSKYNKYPYNLISVVCNYSDVKDEVESIPYEELLESVRTALCLLEGFEVMALEGRYELGLSIEEINNGIENGVKILYTALDKLKRAPYIYFMTKGVRKVEEFAGQNGMTSLVGYLNLLECGRTYTKEEEVHDILRKLKEYDLSMPLEYIVPQEDVYNVLSSKGMVSVKDIVEEYEVISNSGLSGQVMSYINKVLKCYFAYAKKSNTENKIKTSKRYKFNVEVEVDANIDELKVIEAISSALKDCKASDFLSYGLDSNKQLFKDVKVSVAK